jgi:hypothetical protein
MARWDRPERNRRDRRKAKESGWRREPTTKPGRTRHHEYDGGGAFLRPLPPAPEKRPKRGRLKNPEDDAGRRDGATFGLGPLLARAIRESR